MLDIVKNLIRTVPIMKTAEEIILYIELELAEAYEMYDQTKGKDAAKAYVFLLKASTLKQLLDNITAE